MSSSDSVNRQKERTGSALSPYAKNRSPQGYPAQAETAQKKGYKTHLASMNVDQELLKCSILDLGCFGIGREEVEEVLLGWMHQLMALYRLRSGKVWPDSLSFSEGIIGLDHPLAKGVCNSFYGII